MGAVGAEGTSRPSGLSHFSWSVVQKKKIKDINEDNHEKYRHLAHSEENEKEVEGKCPNIISSSLLNSLLVAMNFMRYSYAPYSVCNTKKLTRSRFISASCIEYCLKRAEGLG